MIFSKSDLKRANLKWFDKIPREWKVTSLKFFTESFVKDGPHETPDFIENGVPFLSVDGIQDNKLVFQGCRFISKDDHERYSRKCLPRKGDVLLGKAASVGKVAYVDTDIDFNIWSPLALIRAKSEVDSKFIYFALQSKELQTQCIISSNTNTQNNLGMKDIDRLKFAIPEVDVRKRINDFLERETKRIDLLVSEKQNFINLLKEKRQALISHVVTKGLEPGVEMQDSGVEWIGDIPKHWTARKLKYSFESPMLRALNN